jgi:ketosteroid isomerase-like protein
MTTAAAARPGGASPQFAERLEDLIPGQDTVAAAVKNLPADIAAVSEWAQGWLAAWNARDVDAIAAHVTDDIVYDDPGMYGELVKGKDHFRANIEMVFRGFPDLLFVPADWPMMFSLDGTPVAVATRAITTFSGDLRGGPSRLALKGTNRPLDIFCLDLYEFRDGKLARWTALNQEFEMARQGGFLPTGGSTLSILVAAQRATAPLMRKLNARKHTQGA